MTWNRITRNDLRIRIDYINKITGRPKERHTPGRLELDTYNPGGNPYIYKLVEIMENGISEVHADRMTIREFYAFIRGYMTGLEDNHR